MKLQFVTFQSFIKKTVGKKSNSTNQKKMKFVITFCLLVSLIFAFQVNHIENTKTHTIKFIGSKLENKIYKSCEIISQTNDVTHRIANHEDEKFKKTNSVIVERMPQFMEHGKVKKKTFF